MNDGCPSHSKAVSELLDAIADDAATVTSGLRSSMQRNPEIFVMDMLAIGAVKRCASTSGAMRVLVQSWNLLCARAVLRVHLDTMLRFSAAWLVEDREDFALKVLKGTHLSHIKDFEGEKLTDHRLKLIRAKDHPWIKDVYEKTSGYVHFSAAHFTASLTEFAEDSDAASFSMRIDETDFAFPEFSWLELLRCFRETTAIFQSYLDGWYEWKAQHPKPPVEPTSTL